VRRKRGQKGFDAGKKVKGRKRHLVVDTLGLVLIAVVHSAGLQDDQKMAVGQVFVRLWARGYSRLRQIWADGMYEGSAGIWARFFGWTLTVVRRPDGAPPFSAVPHRWVVERTFGWLAKYRRLSKDYETSTFSSETMIYLAMINLMARRLTRGRAG
jgi:putative transposase